jgi:hypothetical protein
MRRSLEYGNISALGNRDDNRLAAASHQIIALQLPPDAPSLDPHRGITLSIEILPSENDLRDRVGLEVVGSTGERLRHDIHQEPPGSLREVNTLASEDALQLVLHFLGRWRYRGHVA